MPLWTRDSDYVHLGTIASPVKPKKTSLSPDGQVIAIAGEHGVELWSTSTLKRLPAPANTSPANCPAWTMVGTTPVLVFFDEQAIVLWCGIPNEQGAVSFQQTFRDTSHCGDNLGWRPAVGSSRLAWTTPERRLLLSDLTENFTLQIPQVYDLHARATGIGFCGHPGQDTVIVFKNNHAVHFFSDDGKQSYFTPIPPGFINHPVFSGRGEDTLFATGNQKGGVDVYAVAHHVAWNVVKIQSMAPAHWGGQRHRIPIAFLGDGNTLAVVRELGVIELYNPCNLSAPVSRIRLPRLGRVSHMTALSSGTRDFIVIIMIQHPSVASTVTIFTRKHRARHIEGRLFTPRVPVFTAMKVLLIAHAIFVIILLRKKHNRDGFESWVWRDQLKLATDVYGLIEDVRLKGGRLGSWLREAL